MTADAYALITTGECLETPRAKSKFTRAAENRLLGNELREDDEPHSGGEEPAKSAGNHGVTFARGGL